MEERRELIKDLREMGEGYRESMRDIRRRGTLRLIAVMLVEAVVAPIVIYGLLCLFR